MGRVRGGDIPPRGAEAGGAAVHDGRVPAPRAEAEKLAAREDGTAPCRLAADAALEGRPGGIHGDGVHGGKEMRFVR